MSLTFIFRQGLAGKHLFSGPVIKLATPCPCGFDYRPVKMASWKSLTKIKVRLVSIRTYWLWGPFIRGKLRFSRKFSIWGHPVILV